MSEPRVGSVLTFRTPQTIAELKVALDGEPGWKLSSFAHEHLIEYGPGSSRLGGSIWGTLDGARLNITLEAKTPEQTVLRIDVLYAGPTREPALLARVSALLGRGGGVAIDDPD